MLIYLFSFAVKVDRWTSKQETRSSVCVNKILLKKSSKRPKWLQAINPPLLAPRKTPKILSRSKKTTNPRNFCVSLLSVHTSFQCRLLLWCYRFITFSYGVSEHSHINSLRWLWNRNFQCEISLKHSKDPEKSVYLAPPAHQRLEGDDNLADYMPSPCNNWDDYSDNSYVHK